MITEEATSGLRPHEFCPPHSPTHPRLHIAFSSFRIPATPRSSTPKFLAQAHNLLPRERWDLRLGARTPRGKVLSTKRLLPREANTLPPNHRERRTGNGRGRALTGRDGGDLGGGAGRGDLHLGGGRGSRHVGGGGVDCFLYGVALPARPAALGTDLFNPCVIIKVLFI